MKITLNGLEKAQGMVIRVTEGGVEIDCTAVAELSRVWESSFSSPDKKVYDLSTPEGRAEAAHELTTQS